MQELIVSLKKILRRTPKLGEKPQCHECPYALFHNAPHKCIADFGETSDPYPKNTAFMKRMAVFYHTCHENTKISQASLWSFIVGIKNDVHSALLDDYEQMTARGAAESRTEAILADPI